MPTGVDPFDPRPANRREYKPGAGGALGASSPLPYLILANRTSSGSETVDQISDTPLGDEADAIARLGAKSEAYSIYRRLRAIEQDGLIYVGPVTESGGGAATFDLTITGASNAQGTWMVTVNGGDVPVSVDNGTSANATATAVANAIAGADQGRLQVTAAAIMNAVTFTAAQRGPRGDQTLGDSATRGIRFRWVGPPTQTQTFGKGALTAGATEDDMTAVIGQLEAALKKGHGYYIVTGKTATGAPSTTDNGLGELEAEIKRLRSPSIGLDCLLIYATVGTNAQSVTVATASAMNDWCTHAPQSKNNDWTTAMLAGHVAAKVRVAQVAYPAANINGIALDCPKPFVNADNPGSSDEITALNNGVSIIGFLDGAMRLERLITSRSLNEQGATDYRTREGHIPRCLHFGWQQFFSMLREDEQPNADADPPDGGVPPALTTTPSLIRSVHNRFLDEMCGDRPFGKYPGPIFKPSARQTMKDNFVCVYDGGGSFTITVDWRVIEHKIKTATTIEQVGAGY
jgi:phage tail sheath gpL-like